MRRLWISVLISSFAFAAGEIRPSPQHLEWQDMEIGVMIHYGLLTFSPNTSQGVGTLDPKIFNPTELNAEQWVLAAKSVGAKYLVLVVKHHDGFCLFPSRMTKYSVESTPWRN